MARVDKNSKSYKNAYNIAWAVLRVIFDFAISYLICMCFDTPWTIKIGLGLIIFNIWARFTLKD